ncbi:MAG: PRC-barrel domain-containing protein [Candidatus Dormibacteraeota bacterium]|nr:PRC-barrel domain-containing protein [Candidatus Dormibacteraeota bacterium]
MNICKASELKGRAVVSLAQAAKIGTINDVIFDPASNQVIGLKVRTGLLSGTHILRAADIRSIGGDAVTIDDEALLHDGGSLDEMPTGDDLQNTKVVSFSGDLLGTLEDVAFDVEQLRITQYIMSGSLWAQLTNARKTFSPVAGLRSGKDLLLVPDAVAAAFRAPESTAEVAEETPAPEGSAPAAVTATPVPVGREPYLPAHKQG